MKRICLVCLSLLLVMAYKNVTNKESQHDSSIKVQEFSPEFEKRTEYYPSGNMKVSGYYKDGLQNGVTIKYSDLGQVTSVQLYLSGNLQDISIDKNDYNFHEVRADSFFTIPLPNTWTDLTSTSKKEDASIICVVRKDSSKDVYMPNIIVFRGHKRQLPNNKAGIEKLFMETIKSVGVNNIDVRVQKTHWINDQLFTCVAFKKVNSVILCSYYYLFIGDEYFYTVDNSAFNGPQGDFIKYNDLFKEIMFSVSYKGKGIITL